MESLRAYPVELFGVSLCVPVSVADCSFVKTVGE
jgi:hypothetical protein